MEEPTNRELNIMLKSFKESVEEKFKDVFSVLLDIKTTGKDTNSMASNTNGKIATAQIEIAKLKADNTALKWVVGVISAAFIIAIPVFRAIVITDIKELQEQSKKDIAQMVVLQLKNNPSIEIIHE